MPSKIIGYKCKYCGRTYNDYNTCADHEKSHIRKYHDIDTNNIVQALRELSENAYAYSINDMIMGVPVSNFENLLNEAANRLEKTEK